jgi:hypothetical protein
MVEQVRKWDRGVVSGAGEDGAFFGHRLQVLGDLTIEDAGQHIPILGVRRDAAILGGFQGLVKVLRNLAEPANNGQHMNIRKSSVG